ncbi:MAG: hypothetical protein LBT82_03110, partial [Oscillospiraceae bacterium]|nr:hypothetical protein [Oscillospiraceae bacterium]
LKLFEEILDNTKKYEDFIELEKSCSTNILSEKDRLLKIFNQKMEIYLPRMITRCDEIEGMVDEFCASNDIAKFESLKSSIEKMAKQFNGNIEQDFKNLFGKVSKFDLDLEVFENRVQNLFINKKKELKEEINGLKVVVDEKKKLIEDFKQNIEDFLSVKENFLQAKEKEEKFFKNLKEKLKEAKTVQARDFVNGKIISLEEEEKNTFNVIKEEENTFAKKKLKELVSEDEIVIFLEAVNLVETIDYISKAEEILSGEVNFQNIIDIQKYIKENKEKIMKFLNKNKIENLVKIKNDLNVVIENKNKFYSRLEIWEGIQKIILGTKEEELEKDILKVIKKTKKGVKINPSKEMYVKSLYFSEKLGKPFFSTIYAKSEEQKKEIEKKRTQKSLLDVVILEVREDDDSRTTFKSHFNNIVKVKENDIDNSNKNKSLTTKNSSGGSLLKGLTPKNSSESNHKK